MLRFLEGMNINLTLKFIVFRPPSKSRTTSVFSGTASYLRGISAREERRNRLGMMGNTHKSYATILDMKKISIAGASVINGHGRKSFGDGGGKTLLGGGGGRSCFI
ncbi:unnamed protein product [Eruca vesicaria subsp. sativa]|uniref:Uncharacterized protein n=1 Tax=Eruca vesicaria subsp. sativa TaxID=29727 RepID=A0ABC8L9A8_ERUVS|nr:unnamed protein product [Eruca vesicaria subsp. sativa]